MKKITLVLCACAMAFAGLLVSCSNDASGGDVKLIYRDSTEYEYVYELSGTIVETVQQASDKAVLLTTETTTTSFKGLAQLSWDTNDDAFDDVTAYGLSVRGIEEANKVLTKSYSGSSASAQPAFVPEHTDRLSGFTLSGLSFYKLEDKYVADLKFGEYAAWTEADWKDYVDAGGKTIAVSGDIEEDDEITITVTESPADSSAAPIVNKTTTVTTYKLKKVAASEE